MKADTLNSKDLFAKNIRYVIPTFQRPYVWNQEDQWEPLWLDVENAAERFLEALATNPDDQVGAEKAAGKHFLGAIVVQQELTGSAEIETRNVIDGQQRLTTLQLLIDAAQEVAEEHEWDDVAESLGDLVLNNRRYARRDPDHVFKLWPTSTDRDAFRAVMTNGQDTTPYVDSQIAAAHDYFRLRITDWVQQAANDDDRNTRLLALETALLGLLELVVIDLGQTDDAFVIFETLNARGTPLRPSDLVKNFLMQTVQVQGGSPEDIHGKYWVQFEDDAWWRKDVRQGRLVRPRLDMFLDYWLEFATMEEVPSHEVFPAFKRYAEPRAGRVDLVAAEIHRLAATYRGLDRIGPWTPEGTFLYRWHTMDVGTSTPLLLWMFSQAERDLPRDERIACLRTLESYLVRRMVARLTTKDYNKFFLEVLRRLVDNGPAGAHRALVEYLAAQESESRLWPSDQQFSGDLQRLPLYRLLTRSRLRMVLEALEDSLRGPKTEDQHVTRNRLTIEHIMPQAWRKKWAPPVGDDLAQAALDRDRLIHSIGNLTLVTKSLNPELSNDIWGKKSDTMSDHTVLMLNKELLRRWPKDWAEAEIAERGALLAEAAVMLWPREPNGPGNLAPSTG